jgi:hypothetical protein
MSTLYEIIRLYLFPRIQLVGFKYQFFFLSLIERPNIHFLISKGKLVLVSVGASDTLSLFIPVTVSWESCKSHCKINFPFTCFHKQTLPCRCLGLYFIYTCPLSQPCYMSCWPNPPLCVVSFSFCSLHCHLLIEQFVTSLLSSWLSVSLDINTYTISNGTVLLKGTMRKWHVVSEFVQFADSGISAFQDVGSGDSLYSHTKKTKRSCAFWKRDLAGTRISLDTVGETIYCILSI